MQRAPQPREPTLLAFAAEVPNGADTLIALEISGREQIALRGKLSRVATVDAGSTTAKPGREGMRLNWLLFSS